MATAGRTCCSATCAAGASGRRRGPRRGRPRRRGPRTVRRSCARRGAPRPKPPPIRAVAFSPDGQTLVRGFGAKDRPGGAPGWDVATGKRVWRLAGAAITSVSFAPDGTAVAVARGTPSALRLDPRTGKALGEIGPHPADVRSVAHVPRDGLLATASDGTIRLWDVKTGNIVRELAGGHPKEVR